MNFVGLIVGLEANTSITEANSALVRQANSGPSLNQSAGFQALRWRRPSALGDAIRGEVMELCLSIRGQAAQARYRRLPLIPLKEARARRDEAKRRLDVGLDPSQQKRLAKLAATAEQANTFEVLAAEFLAKEARGGQGRRYVEQAGMVDRDRKADAWRAADNRDFRPRSSPGVAPRRGAGAARKRETAARVIGSVSAMPSRPDGRSMIRLPR